MFEDLTGYKNSSVVYFFCFLLWSGFLSAQDQKKVLDIEKVYLHTDRSTYFMGEEIWYKAYNVRASNNLLFDNSNILYVELISDDSKIIARNKTNLEMGLGHGDFQLQDSLDVKPGKYQLRAYTNWNRNFGDDFVFKKEIEIIDVFESHSKAKKTTYLVTNKNASDFELPKKIKIDFFPEGGSLLENVASVVGFKAVDSNGKPIEIKGEIYNSDSELVAMFQSAYDGMGKFQLLPIEGKSYYAKIVNLAGEQFRQELPKVAKQGYLLSFRAFKGKNIVSINTNQATLLQNPNASLTIVCKSKEIPYLETTQILTETALAFELPKEKVPDGINQITLFDTANKPQSERLIYVEKEHDLDIQLTADKPTYQPDEKVTLNVSSKSKSGVAKSASFSLSVTDRNGVEDNDFDSNISSYFLMESDIRGKVDHPAYYFDATNLKRLEHLDNLLLTQGWRDFVWKTTPKSDDAISYTAEKGITISGRVKQLLGEKALVNNTMTLALINKKHMNIFNAVTDSLGSFKFENLMFSGKTNMFLNSRNTKGKFRGEIVVNPIEQPPLPIDFKNQTINWTLNTRTLVSNVFKKYTAFGVKPENVLDEVIITKSKNTKTTGLIGIPEFTYIADESAAQYTDIYQLIEQKIPGTIANIDGVRFTRYEGTPLFVVDGFEVIDNIQVSTILPQDVLKIEAIKLGISVYGPQAANGVIAIATKMPDGNRAKKESFHSIKKEVEGFYTARVFYSPDPEKPNPDLDNEAGVRNTIYWNPYVHPDKTGNATVNYFNTKVETKVKVSLEGITGAGIPVVKNIYYTIKK